MHIPGTAQEDRQTTPTLPEGFHIKTLPNFAAEFLTGGQPRVRTVRSLELPVGAVVPHSEQIDSAHFGCRITDTGLRAEKLRRFAQDCSWAIDHVYFGGEGVAKNKAILDANNITHVVNCVCLEVQNVFDRELKYLGLFLQDSGWEDILAVLYDVFDFIQEAKESQGNVFVHCSQGVSRSAALVIAYVMWRKKQGFDVTREQLKTQRGVVDPNVNFCTQLMAWDKRFHPPPDGFLRIYRLAPQSTHQPAYLVPKMCSCFPKSGSASPFVSHVLDPRGTFVIHGPDKVFIWIGSKHAPAYLDSARRFAHQLVVYENAVEAVEMDEGSEINDLFDLLAEQTHVNSIRVQEEESFTSDYDKFSPIVRLSSSMKEQSQANEFPFHRSFSEC